MKKLFLIFVVFLALCLAAAGCLTTPLAFEEQIRMGGEVAIVDYWATAGINTRASNFGERSPIYGITLVVANSTDRYVEVEASCRFEDRQLFGKSRVVSIKAHSKRKIMVLGFDQCASGVCESERVRCSLRQNR